MDNVKKHFQEEAEVFDELIKTLIPHYQDMIRALVGALPFHHKEKVKVLDLGSGTGNLSLAVKKKFPKARITCLDMTDSMIQQTQLKLADYPDVDYVVGDLRDLEARFEYDVVLSSLAIHHLSRVEQKSFYPKIYAALKESGVFYNADILLSSSPHLNKMCRENWGDFMLQTYSQKEVDGIWFSKHQEEDYPQPLSDHLKWLKEAGFQDLDVVWKYYYFGFYGGKK
ncbi:MAG: methyltransferase type 12 [Methanobacteriales archaeon Met13]